jgi:hypothetical protein
LVRTKLIARRTGHGPSGRLLHLRTSSSPRSRTGHGPSGRLLHLRASRSRTGHGPTGRLLHLRTSKGSYWARSYGTSVALKDPRSEQNRGAAIRAHLRLSGILKPGGLGTSSPSLRRGSD